MKSHLLIRLLMVFFLGLSVSCTKNNEDIEEQFTVIENQIIDTSVTKNQIEKVISQMKILGDIEEKIIVFDVKNIGSKNISDHFEIMNPSKKEYVFYTGSSKVFLGPGDDYTVTCTWGNGETEVTECGESTAFAGAATWDCLENGGCATVCNAKITYIPSSYKLREKKLEKIVSVLQEVEKISQTQNNESLEVSITFDSNEFWLKDTSKIQNTNSSKNSSRSWQVDCFGSDGELLWSETYDDRLGASAGILQCTDNDGGCANVCEIVGIKYFNNNTKK